MNKLSLSLTISCFFVSFFFGSARASAQVHDTEPDSVISETVSPQFQSRFGLKVVVHEDYAFVWVRSDETSYGFSLGAVHVFRRTGEHWSFLQRIQPFRNLGPTVNWCFGSCFLPHGNELLVGAFCAPLPLGASGMFARYERVQGRYELAQVVSDGPGYGQAYNLGRTVLLHDGSLFVVASGAPTPVPGGGAVLRYERPAPGEDWVLAEEIVRSPSASGGVMGMGMCMEEDRLIVNHRSFYASVFQKISGQWIQTQELIPNGNADVYEVVGGGGWLHFADADRATGSPLDRPGSVVEYRWTGSEYEYQRRIFAGPDALGGDGFGTSIARLDDTIVVGARTIDSGSGFGNGGAYILKPVGGVWTIVERLVLPSSGPAQTIATMGVSVDIQDDTILVGSEFYETVAGSGQNPGAVMVFDRPFGDHVCDGVPNSTGESATLQIRGNRNASAGAIRVEAESLPPNAFTLFFAGLQAGFTPLAGGSVGNLCIFGSSGRFGAGQASPTGSASWNVNTSLIPTGLGGSLDPGGTLVFQTWYRDVGTAPTTNFSEAVTVTFR